MVAEDETLHWLMRCVSAHLTIAIVAQCTRKGPFAKRLREQHASVSTVFLIAWHALRLTSEVHLTHTQAYGALVIPLVCAKSTLVIRERAAVWLGATAAAYLAAGGTLALTVFLVGFLALLVVGRQPSQTQIASAA